MPADERRRVILTAAEEVFARRGYHHASLDEIAHAAGVSKALIYEHFSSKRELHASMLASRADDVLARLRRGAEHGTTSEERLRNGIDALLGFVEEHHEAWRALFRDAADPHVAELVHGMQEQATGVVAAVIAADPGAAVDPALPPSERERRVEMHALLLSGAIQSLATWWHQHPDVPRAVVVERATTFCWAGVSGLRERPWALRPGSR
jgi:AcrR family transcriptional regulator